MVKLPTKYAIALAAFPLALLVSGCSSDVYGVGHAGINQVAAGDWDAARVSFNEDYNAYPDHPIAVFNKGVTFHHDGDVNKADTLFSEAVVRGKGYQPYETLEPEHAPEPAMPMRASLTVAEHACNRLHRDNKLDPNCGDRIVALEVAPPPPAPVAEAAPEPEPAIAAEATIVPPPKQDRH
jgi:hypothetical protein